MIIKRGDSGTTVKLWQQFLIEQKFLFDVADGKFGPRTEAATISFQKKYSLSADGKAGNNTLSKAAELGFKFENELSGKIKHDIDMMMWIKKNLGDVILDAIAPSNYTDSLLAGICARETGFLFRKYNNQGRSFSEICQLMKGDYHSGRYHGYGFWQIDIRSYPEFVESGDWKDPAKTVSFAVRVLDEKRNFLMNRRWRSKLNQEDFLRATVAAYNCGQGNVNKALLNGYDIDRYTFNHDYSKEVFRYKNIYQNLIVSKKYKEI